MLLFSRSPLAAAFVLFIASAPFARGDTAASAAPAAATDTANLSITLDDTYPAIGVTPGSSSWVAYDIVAANDGPGDAVATITSQVPLRTTWRCSATGGATCPATAGGVDVNHTIAMPAGARVIYRLECGAWPIFTAFPARARITSATHDDNLDDNTAIVVTPVFNHQNADLAVTIDADRDSAMVGDMVNYTVRAYNAGTIASNAEIIVSGSAYLDTLAWTCSGADGGSCGDSLLGAEMLLSQLVQLPPGASATLVVSAPLLPTAATAGDETFVERAWVFGRNTNDLATADNNAQAVARVALFRSTFDD